MGAAGTSSPRPLANVTARQTRDKKGRGEILRRADDNAREVLGGVAKRDGGKYFEALGYVRIAELVKLPSYLSN